ncbi:FkbM family methyltransferase, partial [Streptomyces albidoflavus]
VKHSALEKQVVVHPFALGETTSTASFDVLNAGNLGSQSLRPGSGNIPVRTLDSLKLRSRIDAIKIDVEGMELEVLKGGRQLLEQHKPMLYVECIAYNQFRDILLYLTQLGYKYQETFNATPTHLFIHSSDEKLDGTGQQEKLANVERLYSMNESTRVNKELADCRRKYREATGLNKKVLEDLEVLTQANTSLMESRKKIKIRLKR